MAVGHVLGILVAVLAVPFGTQLFLHLLSLDARMSDTDPLTGLRNRRGYDHSVLQLVATADRTQSQWLAVMLVDLTESNAPVLCAERLREAVAEMPFGVTASAGVATVPVNDLAGASAGAIIKQLGESADAAMYEAKRAGANQVRYRTAASPG